MPFAGCQLCRFLCVNIPGHESSRETLNPEGLLSGGRAAFPISHWAETSFLGLTLQQFVVSTWRLAGQVIFCNLLWFALVSASPHRYSNGLRCSLGEGRKDFYIYRLARTVLKSQTVRKNQKNNGGEGKHRPHKLSTLISLLVSGTFSCSGHTSCEIISFFPFSLICLLYSHEEGGASTCIPGVLLQRKQLNGLAHQQLAAGLFVWVFLETYLLNVLFGKRLSTFSFPWSCVRICCRHELLQKW